MIRSFYRLGLLFIICIIFFAVSDAQTSLSNTDLSYVGVNLAGAEFTPSQIPGNYGFDYIYPNSSQPSYFFSKGMNVFRVPFLWERLQPSQFSEFDSQELKRLDDVVNMITVGSNYVILDPHNGARYYGTVIGNSGLPNSAFSYFWEQLAGHYKDNPRVVFSLMNEPHDMPTEQWVSAANAAINSIRSTGATNLILVQGNGYSGAHSWADSWYGTPNSVEMLKIIDPLDNYAIDVHQFLDSDSSGTSDQCVSATIGSERLQVFTGWLRTNNLRGFLSEFAGGRNATCYLALDDILNYLNGNSDVWLGWTYWAAGAWWGDYIFTLEPNDGIDQPQMSVLSSYLFDRHYLYLPLTLKIN